MDKSTLSNYGWVVIVTLVLAVMLALATPFGDYVAKGASNVIKTFANTSNDAIDEDNIDTMSKDWDKYLNDSDIKHNDKVPEGGKYIDVDGNEYDEGDKFPEAQNGDEYEYGTYRYTYKDEYKGWNASALNRTTTEYYEILLEEINGEPLTALYQTYARCAVLKGFEEGWRIPSSVTNMSGTFVGCPSLTEFPNTFRIPNGVTTVQRLFHSAKSLTHLPDNFVIPNTVLDTSDMFNGCNKLEKLPEGFTIPNSVTKCDTMFAYCYALKTLPNSFRLSNNITEIDRLFMYCTLLESIPEGFTIPENCTNIFGLFIECTSLKSIPDSFKIPAKTTVTQNLFINCSSLETIPNNFTIPSTLKKTNSMFEGCANLSATIIINSDLGFDANNVANYDKMFAGTTKSITITGTSPQLTEIAATSSNGNVSIA